MIRQKYQKFKQFEQKRNWSFSFREYNNNQNKNRMTPKNCSQNNSASNSFIWTQQQENLIYHLKEIQGVNSWAQVAAILSQKEGNPTFSGKQCRERYINFVKFRGKEGTNTWTFDEENKLYELYNQFGSQWVRISEEFQTKSQNCLKNKFYGSVRKLVRRLNFVGKQEKKMKKQLKYQSVLKPLEFSLKEYERYFQSTEELELLKGEIMNLIRGQHSDNATEDELELINKINLFNLKTRSMTGRKAKGKPINRKTLDKKVKINCYGKKQLSSKSSSESCISQLMNDFSHQNKVGHQGEIKITEEGVQQTEKQLKDFTFYEIQRKTAPENIFANFNQENEFYFEP